MVDAHREVHGVEPICRVLGVAPSTYYAVKARERNPSQRALRDQRAARGDPPGAQARTSASMARRKVWWQLQREGIETAQLHR